jgi:pyruvate ferredoxin oxidoreductase alpha subunit
MGKRVALEASIAAAEAVKMVDCDFVSAYPITPQTHIPEMISEMVANGELNAACLTVESEHSAMSSCLGAAATGCRTFTATAGQGLELMHEAVWIASAHRYPIVMAVCNRAMSAPLSVWGDHSDVMSVRDVGWIQIFTNNAQEVFDLTVWAFRCGEDPRVLLPVMVNLDGFTLSHVTESLLLPDEKEVKEFLPPLQLPNALHPDKPTTHGAFGLPNIYSEMRIAQEIHLRKSKEFIIETLNEFGDKFGRYYKPVETYKAEGKKTLLMTMGSFSETAKIIIDELEAAGESVGLVYPRLWRPFPFEELYAAVKDADNLIVFDRSISYGGQGGPLASEVKSALYGKEKAPKVASIVGGLGGRDVSVEQFRQIIEKGKEIAENGSEELYETVGIRGTVSGIRG